MGVGRKIKGRKMNDGGENPCPRFSFPSIFLPQIFLPDKPVLQTLLTTIAEKYVASCLPASIPETQKGARYETHTRLVRSTALRACERTAGSYNGSWLLRRLANIEGRRRTGE